MERIYGAELGKYVGQKVKVAGWVYNLRKLGKVNFLTVRDVSGIFQVFLTKAEATQLDDLLPESVIELTGDVIAEPQAAGGCEIHHPEITVLSRVSEGLPFSLNQPVLKAHLDTFLDCAPFGLRYPQKRALFRLSAGIMQGFRSYLDQAGFTEIATPKLVESATESGANVFAVNYFDRPGLPGAKSAVLQADHGGGVRESVRSRPGFPCRTACNNPPSQRIRQYGCRDGVHQRPLRRHGAPESRCQGHLPASTRELRG